MEKVYFSHEQLEAVVSALKVMGFEEHMPSLYNQGNGTGKSLRKLSKDDYHMVEFDFFPLIGTDGYSGCVWTWTVDFQGRANADTVKPFKVDRKWRYFNDYQGFMDFLVAVVKKYF